jgi:predicted DNA binding CopG/RHH family protein
MKRKRIYDEDAPSGQARIIPDFLPSPEEIAMSFKKQKVTILLDQRSVEFFKTQAQRAGAKYQQLMREVLRRYAAHHHSRKAA